MPRFSLLLLGLALGCGTSAPPPNHSNGVVLTRPEYASLTQAAGRVPALQAEIQRLAQRVSLVEQRVGLKPLNTDRLSRMEGGNTSLNFAGKAAFVSTPSARGEKRSMPDHLAAFDGYVIAYWATWCVPCISDEELVHLKDLQGQLRRHNIELVSIAIDGLKKVRSHQKAGRWLYPLWQKVDAHLDMLPRALIQKVGVNLPLFLVVSKTGQVRYYYNRKLDDAAVRDIVSATASVCRL